MASDPVGDDAQEATERPATEGRVVVLPEAEFDRLVRLSLDLTSGLHTATSERLQLNRETRTALVQSLKHVAIALSAMLRRRESELARKAGADKPEVSP
jgi:CRP-like cAMP-binding protein